MTWPIGWKKLDLVFCQCREKTWGNCQRTNPSYNHNWRKINQTRMITKPTKTWQPVQNSILKAISWIQVLLYTFWESRDVFLFFSKISNDRSILNVRKCQINAELTLYVPTWVQILLKIEDFHSERERRNYTSIFTYIFTQTFVKWPLIYLNL